MVTESGQRFQGKEEILHSVRTDGMTTEVSRWHYTSCRTGWPSKQQNWCGLSPRRPYLR